MGSPRPLSADRLSGLTLPFGEPTIIERLNAERMESDLPVKLPREAF